VCVGVGGGVGDGGGVGEGRRDVGGHSHALQAVGAQLPGCLHESGEGRWKGSGPWLHTLSHGARRLHQVVKREGNQGADRRVWEGVRGEYETVHSPG
jgi:hypothetical protein